MYVQTAATLLAAVWHTAQGAVLDASACFTRYGNTDVINTRPAQTHWRVGSERACLRICVGVGKSRCASVIYDVQQRQCLVFNVDSRQPGLLLIPTHGRVMYEHADDYDNCIQGKTSTTAAPPAVDAKSGKCAADERMIVMQFGVQSEYATRTGDRGEVIYKGITLNQCIQHCQQNTDLNQAGQLCWGFTFRNSSTGGADSKGDCEVYPEPMYPLGVADVRLATFPNETAVAKLCIPASMSCPSTVWHGSSAVGLSGSTARTHTNLPDGAAGLLACLQLCADAIDFTCKSAFYLDQRNECILKDALPAERPPAELEPQLLHKHSIYFVNPCALDGNNTTSAPTTVKPTKSLRAAVKKETSEIRQTPKPAIRLQPAPGTTTTEALPQGEMSKAEELLVLLDENESALLDILDEADRILLHQQQADADVKTVNTKDEPSGAVGEWTSWSPCTPVMGMTQLQVSIQVRHCVDNSWQCDGQRLRIRPCKTDGRADEFILTL